MKPRPTIIDYAKPLLLVFCLTAMVLSTYGQTANTSAGCFPLTVEFDAPNGSSSYFWEFADGATSTLESPSHTFTSAGTYIVEFSESSGGSVVGTVTISVYETPIPTFTSSVNGGCAPLAVDFVNNTALPPGVTVSEYSWVFSDGGSDSGPTSSYVFSSADSYSVSLGLTTNLPSCDATLLYPDYITATVAPSVSFSVNPNPPIICDPPAVFSFINSSSSPNPLTYSWDFDNGQTSTATNPPSQTYNAEGTYVVELIASDDFGCESTSTLTLGVGQPEASFQVPDTVCIDVSTSMFNLSPSGNYTWNFGPNASPSTSSQVNPSVTFNSAGFQDITLTINGECPDDTTITVYVEEVSAIFTADPVYSCESPVEVTFTPDQSGLNYFWTFQGGATSTLENPVHVYQIEDTTTYSINGERFPVGHFLTTLDVTSNAGCTASYFLWDTINEPNSIALPSAVDGCAPLTVDFTDASNSAEDIIEWSYVFGDGDMLSVGNDEVQTHTYTEPGEYEFYTYLTNDAGCMDTSYVQIISVGEQLSPDFSLNPIEVCPGETVSFTDETPDPEGNIDAWHYTAEDAMMFHCFQEGDVDWAFNNVAGPQDVTLTVEYNGCYSSVTQTAAINVLGPIADLSFICDCDNPYTIEFINNCQLYDDVIWDFGDGNTSTDIAPTHTYASTGDYQVTVQATNNSSGCEPSVHSRTVHIRDIQAGLTIPVVACQGVEFGLEAGDSQDVHTECYRGYNYSFSDPDVRPITSESPLVLESIPNVGPLEVTLTVTDINGCTATSTANTTIYGIQSEFTITPLLSDDEICFPADVNFTNLSVGDTTIVDWSWDFGDSNTSSEPSPLHTYEAEDQVAGNPNVIQVTLTVTDTIGCVSELTQNIDFYTPVSTISASDNTLCSGDSVAFTATDFTSMGSSLAYDWDFATGAGSIEQNPVYVFENGGDYDVNLVFEEIATGCTDSTQVTIQVAAYPQIGFTSPVDTLLVICPNENVVFTDTTIFNGGTTPNYFWDFGNGSTSNFANPGTFFADNGDYTVELIVEIPAPYGCIDTLYRDYTVYGPQGSFFTDVGDTAICRLDEVLFTIGDDTAADTYYWDFGDGTLGPGTSPISHQYDFVPPSGQTFASMVMTNADGSCPVVYEQPINIYEVRADFERNFNDVDTAICFQAYPLTNTSLNADVYYWDFGDGTASAAADVNTHLYASPGTYGITLGVANLQWGCTDTLYKEIVLHPLPELTAIGDSICEGEVGELEVLDPHPIWNYTWSTSSTFGIVNNDMPSASSSPNVTAFYDVLVVDTNTCTAEQQVGIQVINPPNVQDFETIVPLGDIVYFPITVNYDIYFYDWTPDDIDTDCLTCDPPWVQAFNYQEYDVVVTDVASCFEEQGQFIVDVHPETFVTLPTTFTPNGDGVNDVIYVEGWGVKELVEYKIFNRWGELIFESESMNVGWDGTHEGELQNNDIYVYKVTALTWANELRSIEGHINLMR